MLINVYCLVGERLLIISLKTSNIGHGLPPKFHQTDRENNTNKDFPSIGPDYQQRQLIISLVLLMATSTLIYLQLLTPINQRSIFQFLMKKPLHCRGWNARQIFEHSGIKSIRWKAKVRLIMEVE